MKRREEKRGMSALAVLLLFALLAVCVLSVLLGGARVYRGLAARDDAAYTGRTAVQYLAARVRQAPSPERVSVEEFGGAPALVIAEEIGGEDYLTRVYCRKGMLMELFSAADDGLSPEDGEVLLPLEGLSLTLEGGLLTAIVTGEDGVSRTLVLSLEHGEGGAP